MNTVNKFIGVLAGIGKNMNMNNKRSKRLGAVAALQLNAHQAREIVKGAVAGVTALSLIGCPNPAGGEQESPQAQIVVGSVNATDGNNEIKVEWDVNTNDYDGIRITYTNTETNETETETLENIDKSIREYTITGLPDHVVEFVIEVQTLRNNEAGTAVNAKASTIYQGDKIRAAIMAWVGVDSNGTSS